MITQHVLFVIVNSLCLQKKKFNFQKCKDKLNWCFMPSFDNQIHNTEFMSKKKTINLAILKNK